MSLHPWALKYGSYRFSGAELIDFLGKVAQKSPGDGAFSQMAGIRMTLVKQTNALASVEVFDRGQFRAVEPARTYDVALTDFNARGGDGYPDVRRHLDLTKSEIIDAEALKNFYKIHSPIDPNQFVHTGYFKRE